MVEYQHSSNIVEENSFHFENETVLFFAPDETNKAIQIFGKKHVEYCFLKTLVESIINYKDGLSMKSLIGFTNNAINEYCDYCNNSSHFIWKNTQEVEIYLWNNIYLMFIYVMARLYALQNL